VTTESIQEYLERGGKITRVEMFVSGIAPEKTSWNKYPVSKKRQQGEVEVLEDTDTSDESVKTLDTLTEDEL